MRQSGLSRATVAEARFGLGPPSRLHQSLEKQELESKLTNDYFDLRAAVFEAAQVHQRLCAPRLVTHGEFEIASESFAARHLPGDFISVEESGSRLSLALGDISGKGLAAGMWITLLLGLVETHRFSTPEPQAIAGCVNHDLCRLSFGAPLVSMFLADLDTRTGMVDYCSAGHPPAFLLRRDGQLELVSEGGPLLGVLPDASFIRHSVELRGGDLLIVYSDGVIESRNEADEEFGFDRLEKQLRSARDGSADKVLFSLLGAVQDFAGACLQADDMSLLVVRRRRFNGGV